MRFNCHVESFNYRKFKIVNNPETRHFKIFSPLVQFKMFVTLYNKFLRRFFGELDPKMPKSALAVGETGLGLLGIWNIDSDHPIKSLIAFLGRAVLLYVYVVTQFLYLFLGAKNFSVKFFIHNLTILR